MGNNINQNQNIGDNKPLGKATVQDHTEHGAYEIFGAVKIFHGSTLAYDLRQRVYHGVLPVNLQTGGAFDNIFQNYKVNWYPGCKTYGAVLECDAPVFDSPDAQNRQILTTVYKFGSTNNIEDSLVQIYDVLDDINTDTKWKSKLNIYYHVKTASGVDGYIHSLLINKIIYNDC